MLLNYFWIILIAVVAIKLLKGKRLSAYNIKWLILYTIYVMWVQTEIGFMDFEDYDDRLQFVFTIFIIPFITYLLFPLIYK